MSEPCTYCGTRGDIGCKHQVAHGAAPIAYTDPAKPKANYHSPWGAKGNPAGPARERLLESLKRMLK